MKASGACAGAQDARAPLPRARLRQNGPSGKKPPTSTGAVFVLAAQALDSLQQNSLIYGEVASWRIYTQGDPIGLDGGWNRFAYVGGNPLGSVDPLGLMTLESWWNASVAGFQSESLGSAV
ncbi:MAG: RHS repeat-associated core domain-containing protein, partial [Acidovorax temperans]|uniref:RHS repeat-associated core domain-containing protein n=1 Tax=Acidovorax temperans TaxID=80878 RepID=UPI003918B0B2